MKLKAEKRPPDSGFKSWIVPLWEESKTLREAYAGLASCGNGEKDVPLLVRLAENPNYDLKGLGFFKGRVTLEVHDYIHIMLGRGLLLSDEAFVIGFTMGSTNRVTTQEKEFFSFIASTLYPKPYRFTEMGVQIFKDAVHLGYVSKCTPLDEVNWKLLMDLPLKKARDKIRLETDLLQAYYNLAARRYPKCKACRRLAQPIRLFNDARMV